MSTVIEVAVGILTVLGIVAAVAGPASVSSVTLNQARTAGDAARVRVIWVSAAVALGLAIALGVAARGDGTPWVVVIGRTTTRSAQERMFDPVDRSLTADGWAFISVWLRTLLSSWAAGAPFAYLDRWTRSRGGAYRAREDERRERRRWESKTRRKDWSRGGRRR